jgi:HTH-type transcriptional regulator / antitoxin HigA
MSFNPNWVSLPSTTINSILDERGITKVMFAKGLDWNVEMVDELVTGKLSIDETIAQKLHQILGASKDFWLSRQEIYDLRRKEISAKQMNWLKSLPICDMIKNGWINKTTNLLEECLSFFNVPNIEAWHYNYEDALSQASFRKSPTFDSELYATSAWLRRAEIITRNYKHNNWNKDLFEQKLFEQIKPLIKIKNPSVFIPLLTKICADCGVLLAIVPTINKCHASGATKFLSKDTAIMILSFRHLSDDHFWFTFFHEAGHLIMHEDKFTRIESISSGTNNQDDEEVEANIFASECLIPYQLKNEFTKLKRNKRDIISFASKASISPGIVIGQMQHNQMIRYEYLNSYKRHYSWDDINNGIQKATLMFSL